MKKILTLTMNPALDIAAEVENLVADVKLTCSHPLHHPGGGGINVSRAIRRLGGEALAFFPIGGPVGETVKELLKAEGVTMHPMPIAGDTRENFTVTESSSGRQYRFSLPGPQLEAREIDALRTEVRALLPGTDYFVVSGGLPPGVADDFYAELIRDAKAAGVRVILDVAGPAFAEALHEGVYLVRSNRTDFQKFTGVFPAQPSDVEPFVEEWLAKGWAQVAVITLSTRGTILMTVDHCIEILPPAVKLVSAVGAGDSFVGGMAVALARDWPLEDAAAYGTAALLSALQQPGTELCHLDEVENFFKQMTSRAS
jgi:6-phosphofructokinase 2